MAQITASPAGEPRAHEDGPTLVGRLRRDQPWWLLPLTVVTVLGGFGLYVLWTAFIESPPGSVNHVGEWGPYLSPFFSPLIWKTGPVSPAIFVLWSPLIFRASCYYYRKAYYRSFFWDPPACALGELRHRSYRGETRFPFVLNNLHRFTLYAALVILGWLWYDAILAFSYNGHLWLGLGTGIMLLNVALLTAYTFGCHSLRHLVGGGLDCYSTARLGTARNRAWAGLTRLNLNHPLWAWLSLFSVVLTDVYIRLLQHGVFLDPHILF
ncbi:MAG: succinate dehydrogenase [Candidatus Dormibacteraeota bacterium]|nr:succinate dehydrogenase [Candidatus Dormibacteraeota bacterium]